MGLFTQRLPIRTLLVLGPLLVVIAIFLDLYYEVFLTLVLLVLGILIFGPNPLRWKRWGVVCCLSGILCVFWFWAWSFREIVIENHSGQPIRFLEVDMEVIDLVHGGRCSRVFSFWNFPEGETVSRRVRSLRGLTQLSVQGQLGHEVTNVREPPDLSDEEMGSGVKIRIENQAVIRWSVH